MRASTATYFFNSLIGQVFVQRAATSASPSEQALANQCFARIVVPLMLAAGAAGPPIRGGPRLCCVTLVPLIAPRLAMGGAIMRFGAG